MILLWPLLLLGALWVGLRTRERRAPSGWAGCAWFWAWTLTGGLVTLCSISFIGVLLFLPTAVLLFVVASRAPYPAEGIGFLAGIGGTLLAIGVLQSTDPQGLAPEPWLVAGSVCAGFGVAGYAVVRRCA